MWKGKLHFYINEKSYPVVTREVPQGSVIEQRFHVFLNNCQVKR